MGSFSLPVDLKVGRNFDATPHVELGMHNGKVSLALLALMLALQKPIIVQRKELGGFSFGLPMSLKSGRSVPYTLQSRVSLPAQVAV
jgi:hypothetical protein